ncbi:hypothetical protein HPB50_019262 [Hyalomma asiaticum]|uniref:Uncharacterized protein n=1 Tax=Hyalomma asiaticum TaxID=266040 RepID=A0ACB7T5J7_HYAAI|nr:hypothetical protein HPB50_019262 [Hyalomma asiaticum]
MGATAEDDREYLQEPKRPRRTYTKYICIAASCIALVLLAVALSYPISNLLADKTLDGAYKSANFSDNEIDDTAPDGFRPTQDGYKRDSTRTGEQPPLSPPPLPPSSSTHATTTESATTTTSTTQSTTTTTTVTTTTTTTTTEEASTERATRRHRRRSHREEPDTTTTVSLTNQTSTKPYRWFNRTRSPIVPGYIVYEAAMKKVSVHVVYECHCPRSRRFIVSQLLPVYELLREYMHLRLLPFGRARVENGTGGSDGGNRTTGNTTTAPSSASSTEGSCGDRVRRRQRLYRKHRRWPQQQQQQRAQLDIQPNHHVPSREARSATAAWSRRAY